MYMYTYIYIYVYIYIYIYVYIVLPTFEQPTFQNTTTHQRLFSRTCSA